MDVCEKEGKELKITRANLVGAINSVERLGECECKVAGVRQTYIIHRTPSKEELATIAETETKRMVQRETRDLGRLRDVLDFLEADECQAKLLSAHFGDAQTASFSCGNRCQFCREGKATKLPPRTASSIDSAAWQAFLQIENLPRDDPRLIARVAFGSSSPRILQLKFQRHDLYGSFMNCDFGEVMRLATEFCASAEE